MTDDNEKQRFPQKPGTPRTPRAQIIQKVVAGQALSDREVLSRLNSMVYKLEHAQTLLNAGAKAQGIETAIYEAYRSCYPKDLPEGRASPIMRDDSKALEFMKIVIPGVQFEKDSLGDVTAYTPCGLDYDIPYHTRALSICEALVAFGLKRKKAELEEIKARKAAAKAAQLERKNKRDADAEQASHTQKRTDLEIDDEDLAAFGLGGDEDDEPEDHDPDGTKPDPEDPKE